MGCMLLTILFASLFVAAGDDNPMPVRYMAFGLAALTLLSMVVLHALGRLDD